MFQFPSELRWLCQQIRPFILWHIASFLSITLASSLALVAPLTLKWLVDDVLSNQSRSLLIAAIAIIFACHLARAVLMSVGGYLTTVASQHLACELRMQVLRHLDTLSADYHEQVSVGAAMYPLKEPIEELSYFGSDLLPFVLRTTVATVLTLATMFVLDGRITLAVLPLIPVFLLTRKHFRRTLEDDADSLQHRRLAWSEFLDEHLAAITGIQLLHQERRQERKAFRLLARIMRSQNQLFRTGVSFTFFASLTISVAISGAIGYGGWNVVRGSLTVGGLVAFYTCLMQLFDPLSGIADAYVRAQKTFASIRRVQSVLDLRPSITTNRDAGELPAAAEPTIEFSNVRFAYTKERDLLVIPTLLIRAGERVGLVGDNGAGKSTLVKLLPRVYDVESGALRIGGHDVRSTDTTSLRRYVCYVPRYPILFDTSIAENLLFGNASVSEADLKTMIEHVGLAGWIDGLPAGLDQRIGPCGSQLSSGQQQRLGIARALLRRPRVVIFDEATSSLDADSERSVLKRVRMLLPHSTLILISHRLSPLLDVDRVICLKAGRVVSDDAPARFFALPDLASSQLPHSVPMSAECHQVSLL